MSAILVTLLTTLVPALGPAVVDGVRGLIARITGGAGAAPQNMDERIRLMDAETKKLEALSKLDFPSGSVSPWVADLRGAGRWICAILTLCVTFGTAIGDPRNPNLEFLAGLSQSVWFWLFGEKVYLRFGGRKG